jgi:hypothetical protein
LKEIITPERIGILTGINDLFKANFVFMIRDKEKLAKLTNDLLTAVRKLNIIDEEVFRILDAFQVAAYHLRNESYDQLIESFIEFGIDDILMKDTILKLYHQARKLLDFKNVDTTMSGLGKSITKSF